MATSFLAPLVKEADARWTLRNERTGKILATRIETAFDSESRRRGLLGRTSLEPGSALVIAPTNAIHTFFMKFPIDLAFVRKNGSIVKVRHAVPAWRMSVAMGAYAVVEFQAGTLSQSESLPGDHLRFEVV